MASKVSLKNILFVGCWWSALYLGIGAHLIQKYYQFNVFELSSFTNLLSDFQNEYFKVNSGETFRFFASVILFYPLWLIGWYLLRAKNIFNLFRKIRLTPRKYQAQKFEPKKFVPKKMTIQGTFSSEQIAALAQAQTQTASAPTESPQQSNLAQSESLKQVIEFSGNFQADVFQSLSINNVFIDLSVATDEVALLIQVLDTPNVSYIFDADQNNPDSTWFSEEGKFLSPIYELLQAKEFLLADNPNTNVIPIIVLSNGTFADTEGAIEICDQFNVKLAQFNNEQMSELPTYQSILETTFQKRENQ